MSCPQDSYYGNVAYVSSAPALDEFLSWKDECNNGINIDTSITMGPAYKCANNALGYQICQLDIYRTCVGGNPGGWKAQPVSSTSFGNQLPWSCIQGDYPNTYYNVNSFVVNCIPNAPTMTDTTIKYCCTLNGNDNGNLDPFKSCAPGYCLQGPNCTAAMARICQELDSNGEWDPSCTIYFDENSGLQAAKDSFSTIMSNQYSGKLYDVNNPNPFNKYAQTYCGQYPGACDFPLANFCSNVNRGDMVFDDTLKNMCSCFMTSDQNHYPFFSQSIPVECDTLCSTAQIQKSTGGTIDKCTETVCIIDDVTFDIANSNSGSINFSQLCGGGASPSRCYIDGISIAEINSVLNGVTISQACGMCMAPGSSPESPVQIPCSGNSLPSVTRRSFFIAVIGCAVISILYIIILTFLYLKSKISGIKYGIMLLLGLLLTGISLALSYKYLDIPQPLPISDIAGTISQVTSVEPSINSDGHGILSWSGPSIHLTPKPPPASILYTFTVNDSQGNQIRIYESVSGNSMDVGDIQPGDYILFITAYYNTISSTISELNFTIYDAPIVNSFTVTSIKNGIITATGKVTSKVPITQVVPQSLFLWVPPNDLPKQPSFTLTCKNPMINGNTFTVQFDTKDLAIAQNIPYSYNAMCPSPPGCTSLKPMPGYVSYNTDNNWPGLQVQSNVDSSSYWIIDPVTSIITYPQDSTLKWVMRFDKTLNNYMYTLDSTLPSTISFIKDSQTAGLYYTSPLIVNTLGRLTQTQGTSFGYFNSPTKLVYPPLLNPNGYKFMMQATIYNSFGSAQAITPITTYQK